MTVETASYISQLDPTYPAAGDPKSEGDNHLRLLKTVLKTQFPNFGTNAITATAAEVNYLVGVTSGVQAQLNTLDTGKASKSNIYGTPTLIGTNTNAVNGGFYTLTASLTLTLPATPSSGDVVHVSNRSGATTCVIDRNGSNIMGLAENMTLNVAQQPFSLVYADATRGWVLF